VGARTFRDLEAWQVANELRQDVLAITARLPAATDHRFCTGLRDAIGSVCRNLAEGFERYHHRQFAFFVRVALESLAEVSDQLEEALQRTYITRDEYERLNRLRERTKQLLKGLLSHLSSSEVPGRRR